MERPREKLLQTNNPKELKTEELISLLLSHGIADHNVYEISEQLASYLRTKLNQSSTNISVDELTQFQGIGEVKALKIIAALELGRRYYHIDSKANITEDWDFAELKQSERQYGVHFFHHYTAKFIPQIPSRLIARLSRSNDIVIDPFMGSGTTLIEAKLLGRRSYGLDTNPLALKISRAKMMLINESRVNEIDRFINWLEQKKKYPRELNCDVDDLELFMGCDLWFRQDVLMKLKCILDELKNYSPDVRNFLEVGLSTLLKGISNARMDSVTPILPEEPIYTDRKHYYRKVNNLTREIPVYRRLISQIRRMRRAILDFNKETDNTITCMPIQGDARQLSNYVQQCHLVVTSPPYWSAQNYENIHKLSLALFDLEMDNGQEIGRNSDTYLDDMKAVFEEIAKILHGHFALVIGEDTKRMMHEKLFQITVNLGFNHTNTVVRRISNQVSRAKQIKNEYIYIFKI